MKIVTLYTIEHKYGTDLFTKRGVIEYAYHWAGTMPNDPPEDLAGWDLVEWYFQTQAEYELGEYLTEHTISLAEILDDVYPLDGVAP